MSDNFAPGDIAVCVSLEEGVGSFNVPMTGFLKIGGFYRVGATVLCYAADGSHVPALQLVGDPALKLCPTGGWRDSLFRKLPPASDEFTTRIRACKPHNTKVPA